MTTTLKQARDAGKLDQFIAEREAHTGDEDAFNATLQAMAGTWKAEPEASFPGTGDD
jgi:hypothetical protein